MIPLSKPVIGKEEIKKVTDVLKSGIIAQGPLVKELEKKFAQFCKTKYAVAFNSGTAALHAGLYALGIKKGDEVITSPFTFVATANVILMLGATPIFADINEDDFNINPLEAAKKITERTKAIIPVDLYGQPYDYDGLRSVIKNRSIFILEDACQAVGAKYKNKITGQLGNAAAFSLYATKNITSGEGGILTTDNSQIRERAKMFRHHGQSEKKRYEYLAIGYNYRLTDLAAALALVQLKKINKINKTRNKNARLLSEGLKNIPGLIIPKVNKNNTHVFHQYAVKITDNFASTRDKFINYLRSQGIGCEIYYPEPLPFARHLKYLGYKKGEFPVTEKMSKQVLSLPIHPLVSTNQIKYIITTIQKYVS